MLDWVVFLMVSGGVGWLLFQRARQAYLLDGRIQTMDVDLLEASGLRVERVIHAPAGSAIQSGQILAIPAFEPVPALVHSTGATGNEEGVA